MCGQFAHKLMRERVFMAIHLDVSPSRLDLSLKIVYRALSALWLLKGFSGWLILFGFVGPGHFERDFSTATLIAFSVFDLIAGVALWMSWRWGSGVWFLIAVAYGACSFSGVIGPDSHSNGVAIGSLILAILHSLRLIFVRSEPEKRLTIV